MKLRNILFLLLIAGTFAWVYFKKPGKTAYMELTGDTMGTYYSIVYSGAENYQVEIDSIFRYYSSACNTYDSTSELSEFNRTGRLVFKSPFLPMMLQKAKVIHQQTGGAFEPTLMPLINAWGFGFSNRQQMTASKVDSLLQLVSFENIQFDDSAMTALKPGVMVDLSAMGEGFGIDLVGDFLGAKGVENYKVEVGGEFLCKGFNPAGKRWRIGIENPLGDEGGDRLMIAVDLTDEALSTSGSYWKFFVDSTGTKQPHIIDPISGYPVQHGLLSASIRAKDCVTADALSTACMVMGLERAKVFISSIAGIEGYLVYNEGGKLAVWQSPEFSTSGL